MKSRFLAALFVGCLVFQARSADQPDLTDKKTRTSYGLGLEIGKNLRNNFKQRYVEIETDVLLRAIRDSLTGAEPLLKDEEVREIVQALNTESRTRMEDERKKAAEKNKTESAAFLEANKAKEGVKVTPSGLQYKVLQDGTGEMPQSGDVVTVHYRGTLPDGTEFDSSHKRGQPAEFNVTGVIKGWQEALQMMKVGSKWQLVIPSELAYGDRGQGATIGPNQVLIFETELLGLRSQSQPQAAAPKPNPAASQPVTSDIIKVPSAEELKKGAKIEIIKKEDLEKLQQEQQKKDAEKVEPEKK